MINSISAELGEITIKPFLGEMKMVPFDLSTLFGVPDAFVSVVKKMVRHLPIKSGIAYLTVDGKILSENTTHRRGGAHIDGNFIPDVSDWGQGGGNGWKVGEGGRILSSEHHKQSYQSNTGGMLIASDYPACKGWNGIFDGDAYVGGDCSKIILDEGFMLKPNVLYYGNSQWIHESIPVNESVHRTLVRVTLPMDYPILNVNL